MNKVFRMIPWHNTVSSVLVHFLGPLSFLLCTLGKKLWEIIHIFSLVIEICYINSLYNSDLHLLISVKLELHCSWSFIIVFYVI